MKTSTKILVSCVIGAALLTSVAFNVALGINYYNLNGSIFSKVNENWNKTEVNISLGECWENKCYSCEDGDYIRKIDFYECNDSYYGDGALAIDYLVYFNTFDDLEAYFIFDNGYKTQTEKSHTPIGTDGFEISPSVAKENNLYKASIVEVWVRTID